MPPRRPLLAVALVLLAGTPAVAQPPVPFNDAAVHAVQFVDASEGWAVGDDGVVWHSIDGGTTWERQKTGTRASLRGVHFVTPYTGWAAGRVERTDGSRGVLLRTTDGGATWDEVAADLFPGLNAVRFVDERVGVVAGDGTDGFPAGVFRTADGGRSWQPVKAAGRAPSWRGVDLTAGGFFVLGGAWGKLAADRGADADGMVDADADPLGGRTVHAVKATPTRAFAVGDGGLLLTSADGRRWGSANVPLPEAALAACDFRGVAAVGAHVWAVGRPGTVVLHSGDGGKTWDVQTTNCRVPLHGVHFVSETDGWAVGDLGTVLGTKDGGKTWAVRRLGGQRAAALYVHASGKAVPLDTVATLGHVGGYLTTAVALTNGDPASADPARAADDLRLRQAMRLAGGAGGDAAWGFPLPSHAANVPPRELLASWDKLHGGKAGDQLLRQAVLAVRTWQPDVIVADAPAPDAPAADVLALHAAREAFKQAADPGAFPEQITVLGLRPWAAKKLYALAGDADAAVKLDPTAFVDALADSPNDLAEPAARLLGDGTAPKCRGFKLVSHRLPGAEGHTDLMQGTDLARGGAARREATPIRADVEGLAERRKASDTRRNYEGLAAAADAELAGADKAAAKLIETLAALPDDVAARTASAVAGRHAKLGRWGEAREVYAVLADRYPGHPLAADAVRWLLRYHSSGEARRRAELKDKLVFQQAAFQPTGQKVVVPARGGDNSLTNHATPVVAEDVYRVESDPDGVRRWHAPVLELETKWAALGPRYGRDPAGRLCRLAARRHLGLHGEADQAVIDLFKTDPSLTDAKAGTDPFRACLAAEMWAMNKTAFAAAPKPTAECRFTETCPFLDGKLDDACWQRRDAKRPGDLTLSADDKAVGGAFGTEAWLAYDDKFLYVAVRCRHPDGMQVPPAQKRERDADMGGRDRVDVLLDLDRDYQTYYRFQVDHRGCLAEDCWGDPTWTPKYFVGFHPAPTGWTAELAVPLSELTGDRPSHGRSWAVNVSRVVPGKGVLTWTGPASADPRPEGMGVLQFRADK